MHELTHSVELHDEQLDLVAAAGGHGCDCHDSLVDVNVDVSKSFNNNLNNNNVAVGLGSIIVQRQ